MSKKLLKSTFLVGLMTLLSRILGFVRDVVLARIFGAVAGTDAFFVAFKIPNFMRRLFAEGAFSQSFVPVLSEYKAQKSHEEVQKLVDHVTGTMASVLLGLTVLGVLAAPIFIMIFAPGFIGKDGEFDLATVMLRFTFPYILFISLTALAGGILNTYDRFGVPALTPVLLNVVLIAAALYLAPHMQTPVVALAIGVFVAGLAQLLFQIPFLLRLKLLPRMRFGWSDSGVRKIISLMIPAIFGSSVAQINLLLDTLIASFLVSGSVSWLYYSDRLVEFPLGIFGVALATVILPALSGRHAEQDPVRFSHTLDWAIRMVFLLGLPSMIGLIILSGPMIATLFYYGKFSAHSVEMASLSLMAYSMGLFGFIMVKVLAPGFFARQDTRTPVKIGVTAMISNMVMNIVFVVPMAYYGVEGPHAGLALATSISAMINSGLLYRTLRKQGIYTPCAGWTRLLLQVAISCTLMVVFLLWAGHDLKQWLEWSGRVRAWHLLMLILGGIIVYLVSLFLAGVRLRDWKSPK